MSAHNKMNMSGMSQVEMLKEHFLKYNSISDGEAQMYRIRSLPRRIMDLKKLGYQFEHQWSKDLTGQRYIRYMLTNNPAE
tara:strand:+ start:102 stop:341 length:240 start_codon:yes stop_codon:yes gene_type:complete